MPKPKVKAKTSKQNPYLLKLQLLLALFALLFGTVLLGTIKLEHKPTVAKVQKQKLETVKANGFQVKAAKPTDLPSQIVIPTAKINVKITESEIKDGYWEVSENTANHGIGSAYPGE